MKTDIIKIFKKQSLVYFEFVVYFPPFFFELHYLDIIYIYFQRRGTLLLDDHRRTWDSVFYNPSLLTIHANNLSFVIECN